MSRMGFGSWDPVFNFILLILWLRIWSGDERGVVFNPYLSQLRRISDTVADFLRPVFLGLHPRGIALVVVLFLLTFRGLTVPEVGSGILRFGFEAGPPDTGSVAGCIGFSHLSFVIFLFHVWALSLLYLIAADRAWTSHTVDTLYYLGRPFTDLPRAARPPVLLAIGVGIAVAIDLLGSRAFIRDLPPLRSLDPMRMFLAAATSAAAGWVSVLATVRSLLTVLIIGSLVALFTGAHGILFFCRDWIDFLLGPARRMRLHLGMIDLTPWVFLIVLGLVEHLLKGLLLDAYHRILQ